MTNPYEQGGIAGPNAKQALMQALQGSGGAAQGVMPGIAGAAQQLATQARGMQAPTPGAGAPAGVTPTFPVTDAGPVAPQTTYAPVAGFDLAKIQDPNKSNSKYTNALKTFSAGLGSGVKLGRNDLGGMVDYAKGHGFGNAKAMGDDRIDFGDGEGGIDVLGGGDDRVQFLNNLAAQEQAAPQMGGGGAPSFAGSNINGMLQGNAMGNIQQALSGLQQPGMLQQLIAALSGGQ